jgi:ribonuclease BN (tRNA processing enzyme)
VTGYEILCRIYQVPGITGNSYLLDLDGLVLIDSGMPRSSKKLFRLSRVIFIKIPGDLKYILLTHYHVDHVGSVADLVHTTGVKVAIHNLTTRKGIISDPPLSATHDLEEAMESVKKINLLDVKILLSGHGVPVTGQVGEKVRKYCMK